MRIDYLHRDHYDPKLKQLIHDVEVLMFSVTGEDPVSTSDYRPDDPGVHGTIPLRGFDVGCKDERLGRMVEKRINRQWTYDPERPSKKCVVYHNSGSGWHLHLQVHHNTVRKS